jgi:hypothetical protein
LSLSVRELGGDAEKRQSLLSLRERYIDAKPLMLSDEPYENLQWILGLAGNVPQDPLSLDAKTVEVVALWLQDLAREIDKQPDAAADGHEPVGSSSLVSSSDRPGIARRLRDATERFLAAFGYSLSTVEAAVPAGEV